MLVAVIQKEVRHYQTLSPTTRLLVLSYFFRSAAYPIISTFTSAYIWQGSHDVMLLILYNAAACAALPPMFMFNKFLLGRIELKTLYGIGIVLTGLSALLVVFYTSTSPVAYIIYGLVYGIGNGIYWSNRNFLTLKHTDSQTRSYFTGLNFSLSTMASTVVPIVAGWFIVLTVSAHIFPTAKLGYGILTILAFGLLIITGWIIQKGIFEKPILTEPKPTPFSPLWQKARLLSIAIGLVDGPLYILPTVLVLKLANNEGILGSVNSIMAIITAAVTYIFGRWYRQKYYLRLFTMLLGIFILAAVPLLWTMGYVSVIWYVVVVNLADNLIWTVNEPKLMDIQDDESKMHGITHYRLIVDRELFLNIGRIGLFAIFAMLTVYTPTMAITYTGILSGIIAVVIITPIFFKKLTV